MEKDDLGAFNDVPNGERETRRPEPANAHGLPDARPERPCHRSLADGIQRVTHLLGEAGPEPGQLKLVTSCYRSPAEVRVAAAPGMERNPHVLPATPVLGEPCLCGLPVLGCDQACSNFASAFVELPDPNFSSG
jgi:hypothetical protein